MNWTDVAKRVVAETMAANQGADPKAMRKALHDAYPFGPREYWPYKAWCKAVREALNPPAPKVKPAKAPPVPVPVPEGQFALLENDK